VIGASFIGADHCGTMRKRPSYWPAERSLFHDRAKRSVVATVVVWALSIAAAVLLASYLRQPNV